MIKEELLIELARLTQKETKYELQKLNIHLSDEQLDQLLKTIGTVIRHSDYSRQLLK